MNDFLDELQWRGLLHQASDLEGLREHLRETSRRAYVGLDPSAPSLTIGNLVTLVLLAHFRRAGHEPVVVAGGGTGLIGDPGGKSTERPLLTTDEVRSNIAAQMSIYERLFARPPRADETQRATAALAQFGGDPAGWEPLCQVLLCANEFAYVD